MDKHLKPGLNIKDVKTCSVERDIAFMVPFVVAFLRSEKAVIHKKQGCSRFCG